MQKSPMSDHSGRVNVAGRFWSIAKWPIQAKA
jgi:hypothetical protein